MCKWMMHMCGVLLTGLILPLSTYLVNERLVLLSDRVGCTLLLLTAVLLLCLTLTSVQLVSHTPDVHVIGLVSLNALSSMTLLSCNRT